MKKVGILLLGITCVLTLGACDGPSITASKFVDVAKSCLNNVQENTNYKINYRYEGPTGNWSQIFEGTMNGRHYNAATNYDSFDEKVVAAFEKLCFILKHYDLEYQASIASGFITSESEEPKEYRYNDYEFNFYYRSDKPRVRAEKDKHNKLYVIYTKEGLFNEFEQTTNEDKISFTATYQKVSKGGKKKSQR